MSPTTKMEATAAPPSGSGAPLAPVPIKQIVLSGLALLKLIKHSTDMMPELCVGSLVGTRARLGNDG